MPDGPIKAVERMHGTMQSAERLADRVNCPRLETEMRCTRPSEVKRNTSAESYYEITREDSGQRVA